MSHSKRKTILITGASSGLGAEIALQLAKQNHLPILLARSETKLKLVQEHIYAETKIHAPYYSADVCKPQELKHTLTSIHNSFSYIDVLINNAGFGIFRSFIEAPEEDFEEMIRVNYLGTVYCTKYILPQMMSQGQGHIINIASQAGKVGTPKSTAYAASKHAVLGFTNSLRHEVQSQGVYVTAVNPGPIQTPFFDRADLSGQYTRNIERYMLTPEYVAAKVVQAINQPKREVNLPRWMELGSRLFAMAPNLMEKLLARRMNQK